MPRPLSTLSAALVIASLLVGCSRIIQDNITDDSPPIASSAEGVIVGSVTAPLVSHYHKTVLFHYRSLGDGGRRKGVLTSGRTPGGAPFIPPCGADGLAPQCGRLFAVSLPEGNYEIHGYAMIENNEGYHPMPPLRFRVVKGEAIYLGNLHMAYCEGLVHRVRGGILGGNVSVRNEFVRDVDLLRAKYPHLCEVPIAKRLLPSTAAGWRVSYEPYDWGTCQDLRERERRPAPSHGTVRP